MTVLKDAKRGTWMFVVDVTAVGGRRQQVRRRGFTTKKAAEAARSEVITDSRRGQYVAPARGTLGQYLTETWLPSRRVNLRASAVVGYEKALRRILPTLGPVKLSSLDAATIEHFYATLLTGGGVGGRPLAPKTVANGAGLLSIALVSWKVV